MLDLRISPVWLLVVSELLTLLPQTHTLNATLATISGKQFDLFYNGDQKTWGEAQTTCRSLGGRLAAITDEDTNTQLSQALQTVSPPAEAAWIGGTFEPQRNYWAWVTDDKRFTGSIKDAEFSIYKCAYLDVRTASREAGNDTERKIGIFLADRPCDKKMAFLCNRDGVLCTTQGLCINNNNLQTWDEARQTCKENSMKLANLEIYLGNHGNKPEFINLTRDLSHIPDQKYWIGLKHLGWSWADSKAGITYTPGDIMVSADLPTSPSGQCLYLHFTKAWHPLSCDNKLNFICEKDVIVDVPMESHLDKKPLITGLISGIVLMGVLAVIMGFTLMLRRQRAKINPQEAIIRSVKPSTPSSCENKTDNLGFENQYEEIDINSIRYSYPPSPQRPPPLPPGLLRPNSTEGQIETESEPGNSGDIPLPSESEYSYATSPKISPCEIEVTTCTYTPDGYLCASTSDFTGGESDSPNPGYSYAKSPDCSPNGKESSVELRDEYPTASSGSSSRDLESPLPDEDVTQGFYPGEEQVSIDGASVTTHPDTADSDPAVIDMPSEDSEVVIQSDSELTGLWLYNTDDGYTDTNIDGVTEPSFGDLHLVDCTDTVIVENDLYNM